MQQNIKKCRYNQCDHPSRNINTDTEEYVSDGKMYFHKNCYILKKENEEKLKNTKACAYSHCQHDSRKIDIRTEPYKVLGRAYYHKDCYKAKLNGDWKDEKTKKDLQLFRDIWYEHISKTVVFSQLMHILNSYIDNGVDSDYLVFVLKYVIEHKMNLNYPNGFKYYVDRKEIKDAYSRIKIKKVDTSSFSVSIDHFDSPPTSTQEKTITINKPRGFESIIKQQKNEVKIE